MTEFSYWWTTSGTPAGDQVSSYTQAHLARIAAVLAACGGFEGIAPGYLNQLAGSVAGANTVQIATGGAVVDGKVYDNDAAVNVTIPSASGGGNTRIDRIVLRVSWASFTARITRIAGTDAASPTAPAITQTSGTTYDLPLYQALVNTSGTVTITDERTIASRDNRRQGGAAGSWLTPGSTTYVVTPQIQMGTAQVSMASGAGSVSVTFPKAFGNVPLVVASLFFSDTTARIMLTVTAVSASGATIYLHADDGASTWDSPDVQVVWLAMGPAA